jgi:cytochrome c5
MSDEHEAFIKTPRQLITVVILAFLVPIVAILLLASFVDIGPRWGAGADTMAAQAVEQRLRPVAGFELVDASAPRPVRSGEQVYSTVCATCHAAGVAGAPKFGDKAGWAERIKKGLDALAASALKGKGAMPPQGGGEFSDLEVTHAVVHMANAAGANFEDPQPAEAEAAGVDTAAPAGSAAATAAAGSAAATGGRAPAGAPTAHRAAVAEAGNAAAAGTATPGAPATRTPTDSTAAAPGAGAQASQAAAPAAAPAPAASAEGKKVYDTTCALCHNPGLAGAPKFGDKAAWSPRLAQGVDELTALAIKGIRAMPPRGGNPNLTDEQMRAAVEHMVAAVQ